MREIKVIKYTAFATSLKSPKDVAYETDRAVTDYRAFLPVGAVHASRVTDSKALDVMLEVVENLRDGLTAQKNRLQRT